MNKNLDGIYGGSFKGYAQEQFERLARSVNNEVFTEYTKEWFDKVVRRVNGVDNVITYKYKGPEITSESMKSLAHLMVLMFTSDKSIMEDAKNGKFYNSYSSKGKDCPAGYNDYWHNRYFFEINDYVIALGYVVEGNIYLIDTNYSMDEDGDYDRYNYNENGETDYSVIEAQILCDWNSFLKDNADPSDSQAQGKYLLYGTSIINNDDTLKDFAKSVLINAGDGDEDAVNVAIESILEDDLTRTDIDYCKLLYKYRAELGDVLYYAENNGYDINSIKLSFFDEEVAKEFFNIIVSIYCMALKFDSDNI